MNYRNVNNEEAREIEESIVNLLNGLPYDDASTILGWVQLCISKIAIIDIKVERTSKSSSALP